MATELKTRHILHSFKILKGNTLISVIFEPLWGIPYALYTFYLSLYMKGRGITDTQIGFLISIGFVASIICSALGGIISDRLGRKRTTLIFDLISWPGSLLIYLISNNFWMFALAQTINSLSKIVAISWNLMVVEDATPHQQVAAYNLLNTINISVGIFTPLAGVLVKHLGIVNGEKILLVFAIVSMTTMILARNHYYRETRIGQEILNDDQEYRKLNPEKKRMFNWQLFQSLKRKPMVIMALALSILFNAYITIGTFLSLYYAPFLTEVLKLDKSAIAILGGINAAVMFFIFVFLTPRFSDLKKVMITGFAFQILALIMFITIPPARFWPAVVCVIVFAFGFGLAKPFVDSVLAGATGGKERAGVYAIHNTAVSVACAGVGLASGYLYELNPASIYLISIGALVVCIGLLVWLGALEMSQSASD